MKIKSSKLLILAMSLSLAFFFSIYPVVQSMAKNPLVDKWEGGWVMCKGEIKYECDAAGDDCIDQWCCGDPDQ